MNEINATLRADGAGQIVIDGVRHVIDSDNLMDARRTAEQRAADVAAATGAPVRLTTTDPSGSWPLIVTPDRTFHPVPGTEGDRCTDPTGYDRKPGLETWDHRTNVQKAEDANDPVIEPNSQAGEAERRRTRRRRSYHKAQTTHSERAARTNSSESPYGGSEEGQRRGEGGNPPENRPK